MKKLKISILALTALGFLSCRDAAPKEIPQETLTQEELVKRGEYLVVSVGCADCHSPKVMTEHGPEPDMDRYMMGYDSSQPFPQPPENVPLGPWILFNGELTASVGPWGISFAGNLTPHETGIGNWSVEQFKRALKEGKYKGLENSRPLMPPMPWQALRNFTDEDLEAMFAYLQTLKPIDNVVPAYRPPGS
ncbi:MAG: c-type cytochrome [Robiginitalea sp.]|jgi:mono/diheme cytochrome c family protein|nr:MAG: c-type cytochrome [Flavobacteriaceae bacterium]